MTDKDLRLNVIDELDFEPGIDASDIGVAVDEGVVTLSGHVRNYDEKIRTLAIVESVMGVRAIADEIEVRPVGAHVTADDEIAKRILNVLEWYSAIPEANIHVSVTQGRVTLKGVVEWRYQVENVVQAVAGLNGVIGINNHLKVKPRIAVENISDHIRKALMRDAELDAAGIRVEVHGGTVVLEGTVRYLGERRTAERAAWAAPGVTEVVDHLRVR